MFGMGMLRTRIAILAALLACLPSMDPRGAQAETSTILGNAGTIMLDWQVIRDRAGRPVISGRVITYGGNAGYCNARLLVETLDAQGRVTASHVGFIPGYVGGFDNVYFEEPIRTPGPGYRVSITSWNKCGGGGP